MVERKSPKPPLSEETVKEWIGYLRDGDGYYEKQIGFALEWEDEVAEYFLERASEIDPLLVQSCFPAFWEERMEQES